MRNAFKAIALLLVFTASPALAGWDQEISAYDQERLRQFAQSKRDGMSQAQGGSASDRAAVQSALGGQGGSISSGQIMGSWRCRTIKLGGLAPVMVYTWFNCRVRNTSNGLFFEKVSGTQKMSGYLDNFEGRFMLLASSTVGNERQKPYSGGREGAGSMAISSDMVGIASSIGPGHARIEFPYPVLESTFDVIELRR